MEYSNKLILDPNFNKLINVGYEAPSNIALIKYWGKKENQIPLNSSLSFTLKNCVTRTKISAIPREKVNNDFSFRVIFEGKESSSFKSKIETFFSKISHHYHFLHQLNLKIETSNTFPHSAGIASSASSMAAIALCLCQMEKEIFGSLRDSEEFLNKASYLARLGSGSASRSIYGGLVSWGSVSDLYATSHYDINGVFETYKDAILIVDASQKEVSSTKGHSLMKDHVYRDQRLKNAKHRYSELLLAMAEQDIKKFGELVESEALELHALMMTSNPSYTLMRPNTLALIEKIKYFRKELKLPMYFTLDAGPNIHLLYPAAYQDKVTNLINSELKVYTSNVIYDEVGKGPKEL